MNFEENRQLLDDQNLIFDFTSFGGKETVKSHINRVMAWTKSQGIDTGKERKIFNILVEHLQNSNKHEMWYPTLERFVKFYHMAEQVYFYIHYVFPQNQYENAHKWEDVINDYNKEKLKRFYVETIFGDNENEKKFPILGIADLMRRTGQDHFAQLNGLNHDFFSFELIVKVDLE